MERKFNPLFPVVGFLIGFLGSNTITTHIDLSRARDNIETVQNYNAQLLGQLSTNFEVDRLIVDIEGSSFDFTSTSESNDSEACEGDFTVDSGVAHSVGDIVCKSVRVLKD